MDIRLALMSGVDIPIPECQLTVHQPTIKEIAFIGEEDFFIGAQCLNVSKNKIKQDESLLEDINNFQIFMTIMTEKAVADKKESVIQVLQLILPNYKIIFVPRSIILSKEGQSNIIIDESNFDSFQVVLRQIFCLDSNAVSEREYNPLDKKAQEIADKIKRGRERIAAEKGQDSGSMLSQYISSITIGVSSMSLTDCLNLTLYQLLDLVERYSLYTNWDIDIRSRLAGASPNDQPVNWMKNIH